MADGKRRRILRLFTGRDARDELDEELETHASLRAEAFERAGMERGAAREEARRRLGDPRVLHASARARDVRVRRREWLASLRADLVLATRRARRAPGATAVTLLTYALGIGLTTAGFTVVDRVLVRGLPYADADRLVALLSVTEERVEFPRVSAAAWRDWRAGAPAVERSALHTDYAFTVSTGDAAWRVAGQRVAGPFFEVVGTPMLRGRAISEEEIAAGERLAVISESFWRTWLGAPASLPESLLLDGTSYAVVGVVPRGRGYPAEAQIWVGNAPMELTHDGAYNLINWAVIARLPDGVPPAAARAELDAVAQRIREAHPGAIYSWGVGVLPLHELLVGGVRESLAVLAGAVLLVLVIACVNVAGLGLAQGATRADEMRVRTSLGAERGRLVRQLLTEQLALAFGGAVLGLALAVWATRLVAVRAAEFLPRADEIGLDPRTLAFAAAITVGAGVVSGLLPALRASGTRLRDEGSRGGVRGGRRLPAAFLVGAELALALVLLHGTALLVRSFAALVSRDLGFRTENVVSAQVPLIAREYADDAVRERFWDQLRLQLERIPEIEAVAYASAVPGDGGGTGFIEVAGFTGENYGAGYRVVSAGYLELLDVPLLRGRMFDDTDRTGSRRVVVINRTMAEDYWPDGNALGGQVRALSMEGHVGEPEWLTVIGVVGDIRHYGYEFPARAEMYVLDRQVPYWTRALFLVVRGTESADETALLGGIARTIRTLDPTLAADYATLEQRVFANVAERRFVTVLLAIFAALAVLLAAVGLYGLLAFAVARQSREMGVRAALGARRSGLIRLVLGRAVRILAIGAVAGLLGAIALARVIRSFLVGVAADDVPATVAAVGVLLAVGLIAALVPAWRAARADPLEALRAL